MDYFKDLSTGFLLIFTEIKPNNKKSRIACKYFKINMQINLSIQTVNRYLVVYIDTISCL